MPEYFPDTNVLIDFGRNPAAQAKLENTRQGGTKFLVAPPALIELVRGMVASAVIHSDLLPVFGPVIM